MRGSGFGWCSRYLVVSMWCLGLWEVGLEGGEEMVFARLGVDVVAVGVERDEGGVLLS